MPQFDKEAALDIIRNGTEAQQRQLLADIEQSLKEKRFGLVWEHGGDGTDTAFPAEEIVTEYAKHIPIPQYKAELSLSPHSGSLSDAERERENSSELAGGNLLPDGGNGNLLLEGDNYVWLKVLEQSHKGKIDIIYIDPPYNTGNKDFIYNDSFISPDDMFRHSKWLDFMAKRLCIASSLLKDSGILLISCDDHEQAHLKLLCDDIFGNENFIGTFVWEKTAHTGKQTKNMYNTVEYIICYAKQLYNTAGQAVSKKTLLVADTQTIFEDAPLYNASNNERTLTFAPKSVAFKIPDGLYDHSSDPKYKLVTSVVIKNGVNETPLQMSFRSRWQQSTCDKHIQIGGSFIVKSTSFAIRTVYSNKRTAFSVAPKQLIATSPSVASTTRFGERVGTTEQGSAILHKILGTKIGVFRWEIGYFRR